MQGQDFKCH